METLLFNEIRSFLSYPNRPYPMNFWRNYDGVEVDFLCETTEGFIAAEFKVSARWGKRSSRGLHRMQSEMGTRLHRCYRVYLGDRSAHRDNVDVLPVEGFLHRLWDGEILR